VANAYVQPITKGYVDSLQASLNQEGYSRDLFLMLSSGGVTTNETSKEFPIRLVESGPAAGVLATVFLGKQCGLDSVIAFDMGGTTAKISVVQKGKLSMVNTMEVARTRRFKKGSGIPIQIPAIELVEIGAGGGSIANIDSMGLLKVGPESAGADPGPACYGLGGTEPTVTDAAVVLGILNPSYFLGGQMKLHADRAEEAIRTRIAVPLGISTIDAARGIFEVVNENMASALKTHVAERGEDPRRSYLVSFGGAGPVHGYELARSLRMRGVIVPSGAGTMSAQGLLTIPVSFEFARSLYSQLDKVDPDQLLQTFAEMETKGREVLARAGITNEEDITVRYSMDLRHRGQGHEINVGYPKEVIGSGDYSRVSAEFYSKYSDKYGHAHEHLPVELITCRLLISGPTPSFNLQGPEPNGPNAQEALRGSRQVYFVEAGGYVETPIYDRYRLVPGVSFSGPAVIEERESTTALGPGSQIAMDRYLNVIATINR
jgi:N-methylhydantoinase A